MAQEIDYNIFLIGFMGSGKSTIARELAKHLGHTLVEMDESIVLRQGMSINDIFAQYGEEHFRDIETQFIRDMGQQEASVVSCGGGAVLRPQNAEYMKKSGKVVYLTATPETIYERVKHSTDRPILNGHMNVEYIGELMEKRRAVYEAAADICVATDGKNRETICQEILDQLV